ncbi:Uncharacterised protein [Serratia odorifera]|nr:Uncharacterised protein [Serratia odorifera]
MLDALREVAGEQVSGLVRFEANEAINRIVASWPGNFDVRRALAMGFVADENFQQAIRAFMREQQQGGN